MKNVHRPAILNSYDDSSYSSVALKIVSSHEAVIGPVARRLAESAGISWLDSEHIKFNKDPRETINGLVIIFSKLFGNMSVETSKDAIQKLGISSDNISPTLSK